MDLKTTAFLFYIGFSVVGTSIVDYIQQCELKDTTCQLTTFNIILRNIARFGAPEYGIPVLDPFEIVDTEVSIRNILNITMPEGVIYGLKYCMFQHYDMDLDNKGQLEVTCTLSIMGQYRFTAEGHLLEHLFGDYSLHGDGDVQIIMEQIHVTLYVLRRPIRRQDGRIYLTYTFEHMYDVFGRSSFYADNIFSGQKNVTKDVLDMINKNWRVVMELLGNEIVEKAVDHFRLYANLIHESIPAEIFIKDDLNRYVDRSHNAIPQKPKELGAGLPAIAQFIIYLALLRG